MNQVISQIGLLCILLKQTQPLICRLQWGSLNLLTGSNNEDILLATEQHFNRVNFTVMQWEARGWEGLLYGYKP